MRNKMFGAEVVFTEREVEVIEELSDKLGISRGKVLVQGLKMLQLVQSGFCELKETHPELKMMPIGGEDLTFTQDEYPELLQMSRDRVKKKYDQLGSLSKEGLIQTANNLIHGQGLSKGEAVEVFEYVLQIIKGENQ
jgi:hypothetical protein